MFALLLALTLQQVRAIGLRQMLAFSAPGDTIRAVVWYPTNATPRDTTLGLVPARVARDVPLAPSSRPYPLVLISHGSAGNEFGHMGLAMALARAGMVVLSIRHPGDNYLEGHGRGTDIEFYGRSHHVARFTRRC
jgi:predicted dienelactone hydrolase